MASNAENTGAVKKEAEEVGGGWLVSREAGVTEIQRRKEGVEKWKGVKWNSLSSNSNRNLEYLLILSNLSAVSLISYVDREFSVFKIDQIS